MSDLNLKPYDPLYPMRVHPYEELLKDQNASVIDKINSIIDYLNSVGKLTSDVVKNWNTVYNWVMNDGLTTGINNKLESMLAKHEFDGIFNTIITKIGDITTLTTTDKSNLTNAINELVSKLAQRATKDEMNLKRDKSVKLNAELDFDDTTKAQITGTTPITYSPIPAINSLKGEMIQGYKIGKNKFNKATALVNKNIDQGNGVILDTAGYHLSDYIPVLPNVTYAITAVWTYCFYTSDKQYISGGTYAGGLAITTPSNAEYFRFSMNSDMSIDTMQLEIGSQTSYEPYKVILDYESTGIEFVISKQIAQSISKWTGKKWYTIGDSITEHNTRTTKNYHDYIADKIGCTVTNYGIGGTGYTMYRNTNTAIYQRIDAMGTDADLITVFAGVNDFAQNDGLPFVMGQLGDLETNSFIGAVDSAFKKLIAKFPTKTIAVFTPIPYSSPWSTNTSGISERQVADAIIDVANHYSIPVLDLHRNSGLFPWNDTANDTYFKAIGQPSGDRLHPNDAGHQVLADKILAFLNML